MSGILVQQLPAPMASDPSLVKFLGIFEEIAAPLYRRAGEHHLLVSPSTAPPRVLDWLNDIMGLEHQEAMPEWQRRRIAQVAIEVFAERGSAHSIERLLEVYTGHNVTVSEGGATVFGDDEEYRDPISIDHAPIRRPALDATIEPTRIVDEPGVVTVALTGLGRMTPARVRALVHALVPAHLIVNITVAGVPIDRVENPTSSEGEAS